MQWIFIRNAVKGGEQKFHRVFPTSFYSECGESRWIFYLHGILAIIKKRKKSTSWQVVKTSHLLDVSNSFFHCANSHVLYHISCEFKKTLETECSEFLSQMRWKAVKKNFIMCSFYLFTANAVNRGEIFIFTTFSVLLKKRHFLTSG